MAIEIRETFQVAAPIEHVWRFVMDPHKVAACMPGAALDEVIDERTFAGTIKVKVGAVMAGYKGRVEMVEVDELSYTVKMKAEGREASGGTARGSMTSRLVSLPGGGTEVAAEAVVDLTGRIMQVGRGMIQGVSHQLFLQFVARARESLESAPQAAAAAGGASAGASATASDASGAPNLGGAGAAASPASTPVVARRDDDAIRIVPLLWNTLMAAIVAFLRRVFGRGGAEARK